MPFMPVIKKAKQPLKFREAAHKLFLHLTDTPGHGTRCL